MIKSLFFLFFILSTSTHAYIYEKPTTCSKQAGMADSYILALSSQAGFCQTYGYEAEKPECLNLSKDSYQANHLTLHGLWPDQKACGTHYGFCDVTAKTNHCDYSSLELAQPVSTQLKKFMPSYNYGSCLERHEWNKHGSCQLSAVNDYFSLAMRLTAEVDNTPFAHFIRQHKGEWVRLATLRESITLSFGRNNTKKIYLGCKNRVLVDIFISLPAVIPYNDSIDKLINDAPNYPIKDHCSAMVYISNFTVM